jgi:hypothetical protein
MEFKYEVWIGDAAQIAAMRVRKQKTDRQDAQFLLKLMMEDRFPRARNRLRHQHVFRFDRSEVMETTRLPGKQAGCSLT